MFNRFTTKGVIALIFSTLMGIYGVYTIASYGMAAGTKKKGKSVGSPERQPLLNADAAPGSRNQVASDEVNGSVVDSSSQRR